MIGAPASRVHRSRSATPTLRRRNTWRRAPRPAPSPSPVTSVHSRYPDVSMEAAHGTDVEPFLTLYARQEADALKDQGNTAFKAGGLRPLSTAPRAAQCAASSARMAHAPAAQVRDGAGALRRRSLRAPQVQVQARRGRPRGAPAHLSARPPCALRAHRRAPERCAGPAASPCCRTRRCASSSSHAPRRQPRLALPPSSSRPTPPRHPVPCPSRPPLASANAGGTRGCEGRARC